MFAAQAHSFKQQARLAISLTWVAGYTNILTLLACGQATSHVTGTTSLLGRAVAETRWIGAAYLFTVISVFFAGALLSGVLTEFGRIRRWDSIYVLPMAVEAILLAVFALLVDWRALGGMTEESGRIWLTLVPAAAMGLQNATITRISGGVVRTTHVTGVVTDMGIESASLLMSYFKDSSQRNRPAGAGTPLRVALLASIAGSFALGAALGTVAWAKMPQWSMLPAVAFVIWIIWQDYRNPIASIRSNRDVGGVLHESLPGHIAVYHIRRKAARGGRPGRMPNLTAWADHISRETRVVVLDIADADIEKSNELLEFHSLAVKLDAEGISLFIAGLTERQRVFFEHAGLSDVVQSDRMHASLNDAVAEALRLSEKDT